VKVDGSATTRLVDINASVGGGCTSNCDVNIMQWTDSGKSIYVMGDIGVANDTAIFKLDATKADQMPTAAIKVLTAKGDFNSLIIR
jgi:predicted NodU family carbamoyl transferase